MESMIEQKRSLPFIQKSAEELAFEINKALEDVMKMTKEELIEQDAEYGYFEDGRD